MEYYWKKHAKADASTVNKEEAKKICEDTVNYLGSIGSGVKFTEEAFNAKYSTADPFGAEMNYQAAVIVMVTAMVSGSA